MLTFLFELITEWFISFRKDERQFVRKLVRAKDKKAFMQNKFEEEQRKILEKKIRKLNEKNT
jgi:hypothetical protein